MITKKEDIQSWFDFKLDYNSDFNILPNSIKTILKKNDGIVYPEDVEVSVLRELFIDKLKYLQPEFIDDEYCGPVIDQMLTLRTTGNRGFLIMGGVGSGKTLLMRGYNRLMKEFKNVRVSKPGTQEISCYQLSASFAKKGHAIFDEPITINGPDTTVNLNCGSLFIDDAGTEDIVSHFGNQCNVVAEVIMRRYDMVKKTHLTTNLDGKNLRTYYGDRVYSRMKEMFVHIHLKGNDRRK